MDCHDLASGPGKTTAAPISSVFEAAPEALLADGLVSLVQSHTINRRCNHLDTSDACELRSYVERAEALVRKRFGEEETEIIIEFCRGTVATVSCGEETLQLTRSALAVARSALEGRKRVPPELLDRLERYSRLAAAYYVELKCKHLRRRQRHNFWSRIAGMHNALLVHTLLGVSQAKHLAEAAPLQHPDCGRRTRDVIHSAYREILANPGPHLPGQSNRTVS